MIKRQIIYTITTAILIVFCAWSCGETNSTSTPSPSSAVVPTTSEDDINVASISKKIAAAPTDASLYAKRAEIYYNQALYEEAIADMASVMQLDSTKMDYYHLLADIYLDNNQSRMALKTMIQASNRAPKRIPTLLKLSEFQLILKQNQESLKTLDRILKIDPQNAEAFYMLGQNFLDLGDIKRAKSSFQSAVENDPDLIDGWIQLGYLFEKDGNPIAEKYYNNAVLIDPDNVLALESQGNYLGGQARFKEAIKSFQKILEVDTKNPNAFYNLGLAYLQIDSVQQAYQHFDISIELDPVYKMGYYYRGYTSNLLGNEQAAKKDFEQVLRLDPDFERAKEALGQ